MRRQCLVNQSKTRTRSRTSEPEVEPEAEPEVEPPPPPPRKSRSRSRISQFLVCIHVHMHIYAYPQSSIRNAAQLNWDWPWPSPDWWVLTTPPTLAPNMSKATEVSGGKTAAKNRIHLTLAQWKKNKFHKHPESYHLGCIYIYIYVCGGLFSTGHLH